MNTRAVIIVLTLLPLPATASWQSLQQVRATAEAFVVAQHPDARISAEAGALDTRLRLARCDGPLEAFRPAGARSSGNTTVGVRCTGRQPWKLYVPVRIRIAGQVLVARRALRRGQPLSEADVQMAEHDLTRLPYGYLRSLDEAGERILKRPAAPGAVILPSMLSEARAIRRGQRVTLQASRDGVQITMSGKALMDGALQQRIRVENLSSGRIVEGVVRSGEQVEIMSH